MYRQKLNRSLSMTLEQLKKTVDFFPDSFFLVGVFQNKKLIAACICVQVNSTIVYTFYSAHSDEFDQLSPRIFLLNHLYDWCFLHHVTLLDLGTSTLNGKPNFSLLDFKLRMGGTLTPKYRFNKYPNS
jgi:lipid II:glycine glycyltransferase (peptidoglycan interpeptide bridge formation enzyme)